MRHNSIKHRLIHTRDTGICFRAFHNSIFNVTWLVRRHEPGHTSRGGLLQVTCLIHIWDMTRSNIWRDSFSSRTWSPRSRQTPSSHALVTDFFWCRHDQLSSWQRTHWVRDVLNWINFKMTHWVWWSLVMSSDFYGVASDSRIDKMKVSFAKEPYERDYILQKRPVI